MAINSNMLKAIGLLAVVIYAVVGLTESILVMTGLSSSLDATMMTLVGAFTSGTFAFFVLKYLKNTKYMN